MNDWDADNSAPEQRWAMEMAMKAMVVMETRRCRKGVSEFEEGLWRRSNCSPCSCEVQ